ncbi:reverse transcriptase-like protein [Halobacillus salinarum]|uniref:Reverse transcriptase-like protein n=1 Tax=Halobacillus salinarum TaxID=2932257 RepID=A0ABY4EFU5_9BACI|nr:reverse transcriptase-like protein [Halobacillus salinarum]UOQ42860.1 reverse transcriptase-like protein [Halobacillus salinarum]
MKVRIEWIYRTLKGTETSFSSENMNASKALLIAEDLEKSGRVGAISFIDSHDTALSIKELRKYLQGIQTEPHNVTVYFDGGFDIKTHSSGLGCAIYYEQNGKFFRLRRNALVEELSSNNEAEYAAIHLSIQELELLGVHHLPVTFIGDSQVVINQLNDTWPVLEEELARWADRIDEHLERLGITPELEVVSRKKNREADKLATQALNGIEITSTVELTEQ